MPVQKSKSCNKFGFCSALQILGDTVRKSSQSYFVYFIVKYFKYLSNHDRKGFNMVNHWAPSDVPSITDHSSQISTIPSGAMQTLFSTSDLCPPCRTYTSKKTACIRTKLRMTRLPFKVYGVISLFSF